MTVAGGGEQEAQRATAERLDAAELSFVQYLIAAELDLPSVYMSGPSAPSLRRAHRVIESLQANGVHFVVKKADG